MSTFKRYVVIQLMTFVCGIVGPIFLIMFFSNPHLPSVRWAFWWGLFITYADVMIALWITAATRENPRVSRTAERAVSTKINRRGAGVTLESGAFDVRSSDGIE